MQRSGSSHLWLSRFSVRLLAQRPDMPWQRAVARAVVAYGHSSDIAPEEAADIDARVTTWFTVSRPPDNPDAARTR